MIRSWRMQAAAILLAAVPFSLVVPATARAMEAIAPGNGMSRAPTSGLPDFSGWWLLEGPIFTFQDAPLTPERNAARMQARMAIGGALDVDVTGYCTPPQFMGSNVGFGTQSHQALEFLFTPGRVTILNEAGLTRRVDVNRSLPEAPGESNAGTSVGHWEGSTLVVETVGLARDAKVLGAELGTGARTVEHISLREPDVMQIELILTAPELLTTPYRHTFIFRRDPQHEFFAITRCVQNDRSIDPVTHKQRFDLTPPDDLPPPPRE